MKPPTTGHQDGLVPNGVLGKDEESEPRKDQSDEPEKYEAEELRNGEEGGKKEHGGIGSWNGGRERTPTRCQKRAPPPEGCFLKADGRFRCHLCRRNLGCRTNKQLKGHVRGKTHRKALANRHEFNTGMVDCVEDSTPEMQGNGEDTTHATQGDGEDTTHATQGSVEDPTPATQGDGEDTTHATWGNMEDPTPATQGDGEDTTHATWGNVEDTTHAIWGNGEDTTPATHKNDVAVPPGFTLADGTWFRCIVCDVVCDSRGSAGSHVRDRKHREQKLLMALRNNK